MATASKPSGVTRRLATLGFEPHELASLRSLLNLLATYLRDQWEVADASVADVVLVRADEGGDAASAPPGAIVVPCARKPRALGGNAIHRPLRTYELLKVLNELAEAPEAPRVEAFVGENLVALSHWPLEFTQWRESWIAVLAAISAAPRAPSEVASLTGVAIDEVRACLAQLRRGQALRETPPPLGRMPARLVAPVTGFRALVGLVGRKLGFAW